jgi:hypothetical protein
MCQVKIFLTTIALFLSMSLLAQKNAEEQAVVDEGKKLYRSEMASWYGTDLFLDRFPDKKVYIGGYFSYAEGDFERCIFFSNSEIPKVLATISFDSTYDVSTAKVDNTERAFSLAENNIYTVRKTALKLMNNDTLFKVYKNTNLNLIPLIEGNKKEVFVLTGPEKSGVVIFGNDYKITFGRNNEVISKKQLHKNIIPVQYSTQETPHDKNVQGAMHNHLPETGDLITSTDICTLMLYEKLAKWKTHIVVSEKNMNIWTCETNTLAVIPREIFEKISTDKKEKQ